MKVEEMPLSRYYHGYAVIEADTLTEICSPVISVNETDCFALCSCYCDKDGFLQFNILSIGSSVDHCSRGLKIPEMLGILSMYEVQHCEIHVISPNEDMMRKNKPFISFVEKDTDEDLIKTRMDWRLDAVRSLYQPDHILVGIITDSCITEYKVKMTGICGPFLQCELMENTGNQLKPGDVVYAFPYMDDDVCRMYAMFVERQMGAYEKKAFDKIMDVSGRYGISFYGKNIRS